MIDKPRPAAARSRLDRPSLTEQAFRVRPGGRKSRGEPTISPHIAAIAGTHSTRTRARNSPSGSGSGRAASRLKGRGFLGTWSSGNPRTQRVVVKARVVRNRGAGGRQTLSRHVNYVERDGVDESGGKGEPFSRDGVLSEDDVRGFVDEARNDRHHFRIMVTPERGGDLELRRYTQSFMTQVEGDLGSRLDWLAVEHHNTDHPHVHIIVRGVDERGADLVINRAYIAEGFRERAQGLATQELGLRAEPALHQDRAQGLTAERLTYLDRRLVADTDRGIVDVRPTGRQAVGFREEFRQQKRARLRHLGSLGLAEEVGVGQWRLDPQLTEKLLAHGQRAALVKDVREQLGTRYKFRDISVYSKDSPPGPRLVGEVVDRRPVDEISEAERITVASTRGSLYRITLSTFSEASEDPARVGDIVAVTVTRRAAVSNADRNVVRIARDHDGIYDAEDHRQWARQSPTIGASIDIEQYVTNHVKRLEGLERRGLVERVDAERFRVPNDLVARLEASASAGRDTGGSVKIERLSVLTLREQVRAIGPTWLDRELANPDSSITAAHTSAAGATTIERRLAAAALARVAHLTARSVLDSTTPELTPDVLSRLYDEEIAARGAALSAVYGEHLKHDAGPLENRRATFIGRVERLEALASGAHAVVANEHGFVLVPAGGALARQLGRPVELHLGRSRDRALTLDRTIRFVALDLPSRTRGLGR